MCLPSEVMPGNVLQKHGYVMSDVAFFFPRNVLQLLERSQKKTDIKGRFNVHHQLVKSSQPTPAYILMLLRQINSEFKLWI